MSVGTGGQDEAAAQHSLVFSTHAPGARKISSEHQDVYSKIMYKMRLIHL